MAVRGRWWAVDHHVRRSLPRRSLSHVRQRANAISPRFRQVHVQHSDESGRVSLQRKLPLAKVDAFFDSNGTPTISVSAAKAGRLNVPVRLPLTLYSNRIATHGQLGLVVHKFKMHPSDRATKKLELHITVENAEGRERLAHVSRTIVSHLRSKQRVMAPLRPTNRPAKEISPVRKNVFRDAYQQVRRGTFEDLPSLSSEQQRIFDVVVDKKQSCFFTGSGGTGKSLLIKTLINALPRASTSVCATTALAASVLGGTTLHAWAGCGTSTDQSMDQLMRRVRRPDTYDRWRRTETLIIDEVSMLDGAFLDMLDAVGRKVRDREHVPFGGIQMVLSGDFHQLPPVARQGQTRAFCFEADAWTSLVNAGMQSMELRTIFRQSDIYFVDVLRQVRQGRLTPADLREALSENFARLRADDGVQATKLYTHRADVDAINESELSKIQEKEHSFQSRDQGDQALLETTCPVPRRVVLKKGAQVLLLKNLQQSKGLVNGARGVVTGFSSSGLPFVKFASGGRELLVERCIFPITLGNRMVAERTQIPLQLAYATTIHKSQGMTLDKIEVSLDKAFEAGMSYVALSRARSLQGLRIVGEVSAEGLRADPKVLKFYADTMHREKM